MFKKVDEGKINSLLDRGVVEVIEREHLQKILLSNKKLRVKFGIDPTGSDIHIGHAIVLRKLRAFQDLGHKAILVIGDFTATIGDPSGRSEIRKPLTLKEVKQNMKNYLIQAGKILDLKKAEIFYNSSWFLKEGLESFFNLASASTIQQVLRRADFKKRLDDGQDVTLLEMLYPILQGYDSIKVKANVELGGTDQTFNLLMGRRIQRHFKMDEQDVMTMDLLEGLDGEKKMSKSYGNYIGLNDSPEQMFGKVMTVPDKMVGRYFDLCTDLPKEQVNSFSKKLDPKNLKIRLAEEIVKIYYGEKKAQMARENFDKMFSKKEAPSDAPILKLKNKNISVVDLVFQSGVVKSKSEAWRLIEQGGFSVDGEVHKNPKESLSLKGGENLRIGKKSFFRVG
jgi:tyrosyl-tRNA synthetase